MIQFHISISSIRTVFTKLLSSLIIISLILPDCALCMYEEEMEHITSFSKPAVIVGALENDIFLILHLINNLAPYLRMRNLTNI
jgi:hypothetical protein